MKERYIANDKPIFVKRCSNIKITLSILNAFPTIQGTLRTRSSGHKMNHQKILLNHIINRAHHRVSPVG